MESFKTELITDQLWVYAHESTIKDRPIDKHWLINELFHYTFSDAMQKKTLDHLRIFDEEISRFQSRCLDGSTVLLEDAYHLFPSLCALVNLHFQVFVHLPHYNTISQSIIWTGDINGQTMQSRASEVVPWLGKCTRFRGIQTGAVYAIRSFSWKPRISKEQLAIASAGRKVKKTWEVVLKFEPTAGGPTSPNSINTTSITSWVPTQVTTKTGRSLQGDWSF